MTEILLKEEVYAVVGAAMEVHKSLGCGFLEPVYQEAFELELAARSIPFVAQLELPLYYRQQRLRKTYLVDFLVYNQIIVEIKALDCLSSRDEAQLINYLKASGMEVGLLINFGAEKLEWLRRVLTKEKPLRG
ncbi:MAG TPA: GxxExxY protein [Anaerolineales bacterium]|nr:GxxExxY protein [Anaerolineales bacterium]